MLDPINVFEEHLRKLHAPIDAAW